MIKRYRFRSLMPEFFGKQVNFQIRKLKDVISGTYGYILNRKAAEELLKLKFENSVGIADWPYGTAKKIEIFDVFPPMVVPRIGFDESIIGTRISTKGKRFHRIPRPDRVVRGMRLGIPIQIAIHQEIRVKASALCSDFVARAFNIIAKRKPLMKRKP
jgi:hypothetical protein